MPNAALERLAHATTNKGTVMASPLQAFVRRGDRMRGLETLLNFIGQSVFAFCIKFVLPLVQRHERFFEFIIPNYPTTALIR